MQRPKNRNGMGRKRAETFLPEPLTAEFTPHLLYHQCAGACGALRHRITSPYEGAKSKKGKGMRGAPARPLTAAWST